MGEAHSRRSFFVTLMSTAAGAWAAASAGSFASWLTGCGPTAPPPPSTPPAPGPAPTVIIEPAAPTPTNTIATDSDRPPPEPPQPEAAPVDPALPVAKYGGPPSDYTGTPAPAPMYGGPPTYGPDAGAGPTPPGPTVKYGGPPIRMKYGGPAF